MTSPSMNKAIASHVMRRAEEMKKDPADVLWLGDLISAFLHSPEHASAHEHDVAVLVKAALDAAEQLEAMACCYVVSARAGVGSEQARNDNRQLAARLHAACEALGADIEKPVVAA